MSTICLTADVKDRLGLTSSEYDTVIDRIILGIESIFNKETHRKLVLNAADETYDFTGGMSIIVLPRYPIVSVTSIKEAIDYDFAAATALLSGTDYKLNYDSGRLYRLNEEWLDWPDGCRIIYKGGYKAAGATPSTGETAMPDDLREAAILQSSFVFKRRDDIGLSSVSHDGGSIQSFSSLDLLPQVKNILESYQRRSL